MNGTVPKKRSMPSLSVATTRGSAPHAKRVLSAAPVSAKLRRHGKHTSRVMTLDYLPGESERRPPTRS